MPSHLPEQNVCLRLALKYSLGLLLAVLLLQLSGCGFKLRGSDNTQYTLPTIFLSGAQNSEVFRVVHKGMLRKRIDVVLNADQTIADQTGLIVELGQGRRDRQPLSVDAQGRVQEYVLRYTVLFSVRDVGGEILINREQVTLTRNYLYSDLDVLAKANEELALYQAMQREFVDRLVYRLQALSNRNGQGDQDNKQAVPVQ